MNAIQVFEFGGPEVLVHCTDVPVPQPNDNQVLIRVKAAGVNPIDTAIRQGKMYVKELPYIPGKDAAGIIEKVGRNVQSFKEGDHVYTARSMTDSTYAQFMVAEEKSCWHLPTNYSMADGAAIGIPYFTAYRVLFHKLGAKAGQTILIHGASGAVGIAAIQLAKAHGLTIFGTAGSKKGLELIKNLGVSHTFNHRQEGYVDEIKTAASKLENGIELIFEMLANINLQTDIELIAHKGKIGIIGCRDFTQIDPRLMILKEITIMGITGRKSTDAEISEAAEVIDKGIKDGWLKPVIYKTFPLALASEAHREIIETTSAQGKIVLTVE
uniref:Enoyl reductase (ER) domain-containing protein n=1 Tax=Plectus sambesii TaxID=2011161 RepID=A0A914XB37_9BILA